MHAGSSCWIIFLSIWIHHHMFWFRQGRTSQLFLIRKDKPVTTLIIASVGHRVCEVSAEEWRGNGPRLHQTRYWIVNNWLNVKIVSFCPASIGLPFQLHIHSLKSLLTYLEGSDSPPFLGLWEFSGFLRALAIPSEMSAQGFGYWLQWQVGLCAVIIAGPAILALKYVNNSKQEPLNSVDLWKTCWKSVDPIWLLFYRACAFLCLAKMLYDFFAIFPMFTLVFYTQ